MKKIHTRNNLLLPIDGESFKIKETRNDILETFAGKQPHEIFEEYVNAELKEKHWWKQTGMLHRKIQTLFFPWQI